MEWKIPPRAKVYEALSSIGDNHVEFIAENKALVTSSEGDKKYNVVFDLTKNRITSDDNGSKWQGYLGYPSIAVLMLKSKLPLNQDFSQALQGIKWHSLNKKFKRNYDLAIGEAKGIAQERGCNIKALEEFVDRVMKEIKGRKFEKLFFSPKAK